MPYLKPKGTFDILPKPVKPEDRWRESTRYQYLEELLRKTSHDYGFYEIRTPIFEKSDLFIRSVGEASDIISKEMYSFEDKAGRHMSLRPEGTAPVLRAFLENGLPNGGDHKFFYIGPYFRYDRPQKGRFRQFHQYGVEAIGRSDPLQDVEIIDLNMEIYRRLGLKNLTLMINSVGSSLCRPSFTAALKAYLEPSFSKLSEESQMRFKKNPLRILDTKSKGDLEILKGAPSILDHLDKECLFHFEEVKKWLTRLKIPFVINDKLVRGLDYYTKTVFEITSDVLGAQNTIGAGGRYDGLMKALGGEDLPSIGFATGIERILHTIDGQGYRGPSLLNPFVLLIGLGDQAENKCSELLFHLRHSSIPASHLYNTKKLSKALSHASDFGASYVLILGDDELSEGTINVKNLKTRETLNHPIETIVEYMSERLCLTTDAHTN
ncbi:MAG: histidine--tRNA ligase [Simkaniaceae bacterium]